MDAGNPQQGGKEYKDNNRELSILVDDRLAEINDSIVTLTGRVDEMEKRIEELKFEGDVEELCREMQAAVNFMASQCHQGCQSSSSIPGCLQGQVRVLKGRGRSS